MNSWTIFSQLLAIVFLTLPSTRLVVVQHDNYIIKANIAVDKTQVDTQNELLYHYFQRGRIMESQGDFTGYLLEGEFHKLLVDNTLTEKGSFSNGLKNGEWKRWYDNGILRASESWKKGRQHGSYEYFDAVGQPSERGEYKEGVKDGKVTRYQDGVLAETIAYKMGKEIFKTRAKTPSKAYGQNEHHISAPSTKLETLEDSKEALKKLSIYYTDKANSQPLSEVSVIITDHQTGESTRRITNVGGQVEYSGASGSYALSAERDQYKTEITNISIVADEQHVWVEMTKAMDCLPSVYSIVNEKGQSIQSDTEIQLINLQNGEKERLFSSNGRIESCLECGSQYRMQIFNESHAYQVSVITVSGDCEVDNSQNNQIVLEELEVAPVVVQRPPQRTSAINYPSTVSESVDNAGIRKAPTENVISIDQIEQFSKSNGEYYVVVGSFGSRDNADKRLRKIQGAGYSNGSILRDQTTGLWSVYAKRFDDYNEAKKLERTIEKNGDFRAFVKILE